MNRSNLTFITLLFFSFFVISPVAAGEWVSAGSYQPGFRIMDVAVSGDGAYGALTGDAGLILLTASGEEVWRSPEGSYRSVSLSGDGEILVAGGDGILVMQKNNTVLATVRSRNYLNDVAVSADGGRIAAAADDETLRIYSVKGNLLKSVDTGDDLVSVAISPDGTYIAGGTDTGNVLLFSDTGEERWSYELSRQPVTSVAIAQDARTIAVASEDGVVALLSRAGGLLWTESAPHAGGVAVTADGNTVTVADMEGIRFIKHNGTLTSQITDVDASVATSMDTGGNLVLVTDGASISGFIQETSGASEETIQPTEMIDNTGTTSPVVTTTTPVSTQSPAPLMPAIAGLLFGVGLAAMGRQYRD